MRELKLPAPPNSLPLGFRLFSAFENVAKNYVEDEEAGGVETGPTCVVSGRTKFLGLC
jgi:hypothetical protein